MLAAGNRGSQMHNNRFSGSEKLAGLAFTPVLLTLLVAEGTSMEQGDPAGADRSLRGAVSGQADQAANLAVMFGQPVMSDRPVMFEMKALAVAAPAPLPVPSGHNATLAGNAQPGSTGDAPVEVANTDLPDPTPPASEAKAPQSHPEPAPAEIAPPAQPETPFDNPEPALASLSAPQTAASAAAPAPAAEVAQAMLAVPTSRQFVALEPMLAQQAPTESPIQTAPVEATAVPTLAIQTPAVPTVIIANWRYSLPSESHAASVQSFAGQASADGASAPSRSTASLPPKLRTGRAALRSPARLARAQHGTLAAAPSQPRAKYQMVGGAIEFQLPVQVNGEQLGKVTLHVMPDQKISLQLKELVTLFAPHLDPQLLQALSGTETAEEFVTFDRLRAAGIDIRYDAARDQIRLNAPQP